MERIFFKVVRGVENRVMKEIGWKGWKEDIRRVLGSLRDGKASGAHSK